MAGVRFLPTDFLAEPLPFAGDASLAFSGENLRTLPAFFRIVSVEAPFAFEPFLALAPPLTFGAPSL